MSNLRGKKRRLEENTSSTKTRYLRSKKECQVSENSHASVTTSSKNEIKDKTSSITEEESLSSKSLNVMNCITSCNETSESCVEVINSFKSCLTRSKSCSNEVSVLSNEESVSSKIVSRAIDVNHVKSCTTDNQVDVVDSLQTASHNVPKDNTYTTTNNPPTTEKLKGKPESNADDSLNCDVQVIQDSFHPCGHSSSEFHEGSSSIPTKNFESVFQTYVCGAKDEIKSEAMTNATETFPKTSIVSLCPRPSNNINILSSVTGPHQMLSDQMKNDRVRCSVDIHQKQQYEITEYGATSKITTEVNLDNPCKKETRLHVPSNSPCQKQIGTLPENITLSRTVNRSLEPLFQGETMKENNACVEVNLDTNVSSLPNINEQIAEQQDISKPDTIVKSDYISGDTLYEESKTSKSSRLSTVTTGTAANETCRQGMVFSDQQLSNGLNSVENVLIITDSKITNTNDVELVNENIGAKDTHTENDYRCIINIQLTAADICKHTTGDVIYTNQPEGAICKTTGHSNPDVVQTLDEGVQCVILNSSGVSRSTNMPAYHSATSTNNQLQELCYDQGLQSYKPTAVNNSAPKHGESSICTLDSQDHLNKVQLSLSSNENYHNPNTTFEASKLCLEDGTHTSAVEFQEEQSCSIETSMSKDVSSEWSDLEICQMSTQNFIDNSEIEKAEKDAIEIMEFEKSFASSQRQCRELVNKKRQEGSHFVSYILAQLTDINQQLMTMKKQIEIVRREMTNNQPTQHVSKFFSKTNKTTHPVLYFNRNEINVDAA